MIGQRVFTDAKIFYPLDNSTFVILLIIKLHLLISPTNQN